MPSKTPINKVSISIAMPSDYQQVGRFVWLLLLELYPEHQYEESTFTATATKLLGSNKGVWALLAKVNEETAGIITLNECSSIYAGGTFGEISELYVLPDYRGFDIGTKLLQAANEFACEKQWPFIEVGTPCVPRWQRTLDFYINNGFSTIGHRLERNV
jgi:GNAT superfamily N-acetyltransferase